MKAVHNLEPRDMRERNFSPGESGEGMGLEKRGEGFSGENTFDIEIFVATNYLGNKYSREQLCILNPPSFHSVHYTILYYP